MYQYIFARKNQKTAKEARVVIQVYVDGKNPKEAFGNFKMTVGDEFANQLMREKEYIMYAVPCAEDRVPEIPAATINKTK